MKFLPGMIFLAAFSVAAQSERFYLGTYTDKAGSRGIYTGTLDADTGHLGKLELAAAVPSPSFLALTPDGKFLYANTPVNGGSVAAFRVETNGQLTALNTLPAGGGGCHVAVDATGRNVFVANYSSGSLTSFHTKTDGSLAAEISRLRLTGSGPNAERQNHPYLHSSYVDVANRHLFACDLGSDNVWIFNLDAGSGKLTPANPPAAKVPPGSGPRHLAFSPDERFASVNGEMGMNVTVFAHDAATATLTAIQTVSTLPPEVNPTGMTTAEIFYHPSGKWLYVSNRDVAGKGRDSLTMLAVGADGRLTRRQNFPAAVKIPRGFALDARGRWLIVGGQQDNQIAVLKVDAATGELSATGQTANVGAPVCVIFAR